MEVNKDNQNHNYQQFKNRWRHSVNQFSKLEQQSNLTIFDTRQRKVSTLKLKMKNRLAQIDDQFNPFIFGTKNSSNRKINQLRGKIASTNHETNLLTLQSWGSNSKLEQSLIIFNPEVDENINQFTNPYRIEQIRQQIIQELTQYNQSKYEKEMKQQCSKYNDSIKSIFYAVVSHTKKKLYQFCYNCDEIIILKYKNKIHQKQKHSCKNPIDSLVRVQQSLAKIKRIVEKQNNKIFDVFLYNTMQPFIEIEELVSNVNVLKQSIQLQFQPQEAVLRMRLMNLIGKKIGLLLQQKDLEQQLRLISKSINKSMNLNKIQNNT